MPCLWVMMWYYATHMYGHELNNRSRHHGHDQSRRTDTEILGGLLHQFRKGTEFAREMSSQGPSSEGKSSFYGKASEAARFAKQVPTPWILRPLWRRQTGSIRGVGSSIKGTVTSPTHAHVATIAFKLRSEYQTNAPLPGPQGIFQCRRHGAVGCRGGHCIIFRGMPTRLVVEAGVGESNRGGDA
jgi:hypothetical protein